LEINPYLQVDIHETALTSENALDIAKDYGITPPLMPDQIARYMLGHPLDFDPGTRYAYGNVGYLLLGRMIERQTKKKYAEYVREAVLKPLGISGPSLARAHPAYRPKNEVWYYDRNGNTGKSFYPPTEGQMVPTPDGAFNIEGFEGHAGWVCSAVDLVRIASAFDDPEKCPILKPDTIKTMWDRPEGGANLEPNGRPKKTYYGCGWSIVEVGRLGKLNAWHYGILSGVSTMMVRRNDGFTWALLSNMDYLPDGKTEVCVSLAEGIHTVVDKITDWPTANQFPKAMK
jgi:N-acyl-D-amino-acid deacylase